MNKEIVKKIVVDLESLASHLKELTNEKNETAKTKKEKNVSLEDVRAVLAKLSQYGKTADVKELITKYGGTKLSDVDESKYEKLLKEAKEIKID